MSFYFVISRLEGCVAIMCVSCLFMENAQKIRHSLACLPSTPIGGPIPLSFHGLTGESINLDCPVEPDNDRKTLDARLQQIFSHLCVNNFYIT